MNGPIVHVLPADFSQVYVLHTVGADNKCKLKYSLGVSSSPHAFNLAPYHPYVIKHTRTADNRCVLEIMQGPREDLDERAARAARARAERAEEETNGIVLPPDGCGCDDLWKDECPDGSSPFCPGDGTINCVERGKGDGGQSQHDSHAKP